MSTEVERYEAPIEGTVVDTCGAVETSCLCGLKPHADGPHVCGCGGSWEWRGSEFIVHSMPSWPPLLYDLFGSMPLMRFAMLRSGPQPGSKCRQLSFGWVHVKPDCRCPRHKR